MPHTSKNSSAASKLLQEWTWTGIAAIVGATLVLTSVLTNFDFVRINFRVLERIQKHSVDDIVVGIALVSVGFIVDLSNRRRRRRVETAEQRLRVLKATMRTVQDIMNNLLNNMQLFRLDAEGVLPDTTLKEMDEAIDRAATKIRALGNLDAVIEKPMASGVGVHY
jgi:hypothetical protein